jgi:hypothetical protein
MSDSYSILSSTLSVYTQDTIERDDASDITVLDFGLNFDEYEDIYSNDIEHLDMEKIDGNYYIGICCVSISCRNSILFLNSVSAITFSNYSFKRIMEYLILHTIIHVRNPKLHIMKMNILQDGTYSVIIKTYWLRLVQRHWRKVYLERQLVLKQRCSLDAIHTKMIRGKYMSGLNILPGLNGMMRQYNKK